MEVFELKCLLRKREKESERERERERERSMAYEGHHFEEEKSTYRKDEIGSMSATNKALELFKVQYNGKSDRQDGSFAR